MGSFREDFKTAAKDLNIGRGVGMHAAMMPRFWSRMAEITMPKISSWKMAMSIMCVVLQVGLCSVTTLANIIRLDCAIISKQGLDGSSPPRHLLERLGRLLKWHEQ